MMRLTAFRLKENDDLKQSIEQYVTAHNLPSATVVSAVGSLNSANLRMAGAQPDKQDIRQLTGPFEIVSLIGNLGQGRTHLHMSISDESGAVIGGHIKEGCIVHTTIEVVLVIDDDLTFSAQDDPETGFEELHIERGNDGADSTG